LGSGLPQNYTNSVSNLEDGITYYYLFAASNSADEVVAVNGVTSFVFDASAPTLSSQSPVNNASDISTGEDVVLTFSESVMLGSGSITLDNLDGGSDIVIDVASHGGQLSIDGVNLIVNPTGNPHFHTNTQYAVLVDATAVTDLSGNAYEGIASDAIWRFTTGGGLIYRWNVSVAPLSGVVRAWNDADNWLGGDGFPNGAGVTATISDDIEGAATDIVLNEPITIGALTLEDSDQDYFIELEGGAAGSLTFDNNEAGASLVVNAANGTLLAGSIASVTLGDDLDITLTSGNATISAEVGESDGPRNLTMTSSSGAVLSLLGNNTYTGVTTFDSAGARCSIGNGIAGDLVLRGSHVLWGSIVDRIPDTAAVTLADGGYLYFFNGGLMETVGDFLSFGSAKLFTFRIGPSTFGITGTWRVEGSGVLGTSLVSTAAGTISMTNGTFEAEIASTNAVDQVDGYGVCSLNIDGGTIDVVLLDDYTLGPFDIGTEFTVFKNFASITGAPSFTAPGKQKWSFGVIEQSASGPYDGVLTFEGEPLSTIIIVR
jgi:hypothetical protein